MVRGLAAKAVLIACLLFVSYLVPNTEAEISNSPDTSFIEFDDLHGSHFLHSVDLNGTMNFDGNNYSWLIVDLFDLDANDIPKQLLFGSYFNTIIPVQEGLWKWNLNVNVSSLNCTCKLIISSISNSGVKYSSDLIIYLGINNHNPYIVPDSVSNDKIDQANNSVTFKLVTPANNQVNNIGILSQDMSIISSYCQAPSNVCLDSPKSIDLNFTYDGDYLTVFIDQDEKSIDDGYWLFDISLQDQYLRNSNTISSRLVLDINPPFVELTSKSQVRESESFLVYANIEDYFVGSQMSLTWTITDPNGNSRGLLDEESYHNSTIELVLEESGYWDVQLLVRDSANFIVIQNISILVFNAVPIVDLSIDGLFISNGDQIYVSPGSAWSLNASTSFDTINDIDYLEYEWYLDGVKLNKSDPVLSEDDITINSNNEIMLIVYDDDMDSESLTFSLSVMPVVDDSSASKAIMFVGFGIGFLVAFAFLILLLMRGSRKTIELPKWKPKN